MNLLHAQAELEQSYNRNQLIPRMKEMIQESGMLDHFDLYKPMLEGLWVFLSIHKRTDIPTMVGLLKRHGELQEVADFLDQAIEAGACEYDERSRMLITLFEIDPETQEELDQYMYPLPMVCDPAFIKDNRTTGYITPVCDTGSVILKNNHHDKDICLDILNIQNQIPLYISKVVMDKAPAIFKSLRTRKPGELKADFDKRLKQFHKFDTTTRAVLNHLLTLTETLKLTHAYDKRGRIYPKGYHLNYQSHDWAKSIVHLEPMLIPLN